LSATTPESNHVGAQKRRIGTSGLKDIAAFRELIAAADFTPAFPCGT